MIPSILALYLPQFHSIPENDAWWGKGYTEWTAVKAARPLFPGHEQPRVPLNENYYDLLDKKIMQWQTSLMHKYGIDGMCIYHYYFKKGRKILEKPAENLLKWKDIDMPYCFSWANDSWIRSWSKIAKLGNQWSEKFEGIEDDNVNGSGILLEQDYGGEEEWRAHYKYLSDFFQDNRYIKVDNKPVFAVFRPGLIPRFYEMKEILDEEAKKDGFNGIYFIGSGRECTERKGFSNTMIELSQEGRKLSGKSIYDNVYGIRYYYKYDLDCKNALKCRVSNKQCPCIEVGRDDTPRHEWAGTVIDNRNPITFEKTMEQVLIKGIKSDSPFVFINAWNEWGEGNYLEPDKKFKYAFLEAVKTAKENVLAGKVTYESENPQNIIDELTTENDVLRIQVNRYRDYWQILDEMMLVVENNKHINLQGLGLYSNASVMIYGCGMIGKHLLYMLNKSGIDVNGFIDKKTVDKYHTYEGVPMYNTDFDIPEPDLVIVTVMYAFDNIKNNLKERFSNIKIISIREILETLN